MPDIHNVQTYEDEKGRVVYGKRPVTLFGESALVFATETYTGQGVASIRVPDRPHPIQHPFAFPIDAKTPHEAFEKFDEAQKVGWAKEQARLSLSLRPPLAGAP